MEETRTVIERVQEHHEEAKTLFAEDQIVGCFLQGSQNYGLDLPTSDVDTKLVVVPTFRDIVLNHQPVSTTHVRANNEHIDLKDIRKYVEHFRKQNLNWLEILFTDYFVVNPLYTEQWNRLVANRELIARMNPYRAVKSMKGIALKKFNDMEHPHPSALHLIEKYGFDGKQVHHLIRVDDYLTRYIRGEPYVDCLRPSSYLVDRMLAYKRHEIPLEVAREEAEQVLAHVEYIADTFCEQCEDKDKEDTFARELLQDVSYNIMKIATLKELTDI